MGAAAEVVCGGDGGERSEMGVGVGVLCTSGSGAGGSSLCRYLLPVLWTYMEMDGHSHNPVH